MKNRFLAVFIILFWFSACASGPEKTELIKLTMPNKEDATIVTFNKKVPNWVDWLFSDGRHQHLSFVVPGEVTPVQIDAVGRIETACRKYVTIAHPSDGVDVAFKVLDFALTGGLGSALGSYAFPYASASQYFKYGMASGGSFGAGYAFITLGGKTYTLQNCGREIASLFPGYNIKRVLQESPY